MQIHLKDGNVVETDKMTDKQAEIYEALNRLSDVCKKYNVTSVLRIILDKNNWVGMNTANKNLDQLPQDLDFLMSTLNDFVTQVSDGQVVMMKVKPQEENLGEEAA